MHSVEQGGSWFHKMGVVDAVWDDMDGESPKCALQSVGLDVVEARHRLCVGVPTADPHAAHP